MEHVSRHPEVIRFYKNLQFIQWLTYRGIVYGIDARYGSTHTGSLGDQAVPWSISTSLVRYCAFAFLITHDQ
jgi:hypothetical protein